MNLQREKGEEMHRDRGLAVVAFLIFMAPFSGVFKRVHGALQGPRGLR